MSEAPSSGSRPTSPSSESCSNTPRAAAPLEDVMKTISLSDEAEHDGPKNAHGHEHATPEIDISSPAPAPAPAHARPGSTVSISSESSRRNNTPSPGYGHEVRRSLSRSTAVGSVASSTSLRNVASPRFRSIEVPLSAHSLMSAVSPGGGEASPDEGAPFESIALDMDGRPPPPLPVQHAQAQAHAQHTRSESLTSIIANKAKRHSWKQSSVSSNAAAAVSQPSLPLREASKPAPTAASEPGSRAPTPRRAAPPAHPHPFPIPSTNPNTGSPQVPPGPVAQVPMPIPQQSHGLGVKGVSTLDKFISRTRPQHLPPKSRAEDQEHLHEWEHMMAKSKEHAIERRKTVEQKRLEKERHVIAIAPRWEALLNDPDFSVQKVRNDPALRQLWFEGVPLRLRGQAWSQAIGNPLAINKDAYNSYLRRARRALDQGRFPPDILEQIEQDLDNTLRTLHVFQQGSPMRQDLKDVVCAWVVYRSDQARGYAPYITLVSAMFLLASSPMVAFFMVVNFLSRPCMSAFYNEAKDEIDAFYRVFENLQADLFPRIYANCKNLGLRLPESYFRSVLVDQVPFSAACRLWDQIVLDGDAYIFRAALAIFGFLEPRLYYPDKEEIQSVLEGRNRATNAITERERERARLRGEEYEDALDGKLSVLGLHEDQLFEWLEHDTWKDSRFERLVMRELPD